MLRLFEMFSMRTVNIEAQWELHYGAHQYWKQIVFSRFNVNSIYELLNAQPTIDDEEHYKSLIPDFFKSSHPDKIFLTLNWIDINFHLLSSTMQYEAKNVIREAASIFAADVLCHSREHSGKLNWSDVVALHESLHTSFDDFFEKHDIKNLDCDV